MKLNYISILAGGNCPMNCSFCVGQYIRKNETPHFASLGKIKIFFDAYKCQTDLLSISGSTSDPLFCKDINKITEIAKKRFKKISLHTCATSKLINIDIKPFDEICISFHTLPDKKLVEFIQENKEKIRISVVYNKENYKILDNFSFFDQIPCNTFTVRKNIFDPKIPNFVKKLKKIGEIFNQPIYKYGDKKITIWDFADANKYIDARYLWPNGLMRKQCYWENLHIKPKT